MKRILVFAYFILLHLPQVSAGNQLDKFLESIDAREVRLLEGESNYDTIVEFLIEQPLDHRKPDGEHFTQRIYISHF